ncbi:MAG: hypothetical protein U0232_32135 [Thermomicrobiales bacterium]
MDTTASTLPGRAVGLAALRIPRAALIVAPFLALIACTFWLSQTDPDYWWHLRTGQLILETGQLPRTDPFSFTSGGAPWVTHEWLTEVIFALIDRQFGYVGNVVFCALLGAGASLAVWATARERGLGAQAATLLMLWAYAIMLPLTNVRPQMITMLLLAVTMLLLTRYLNGATRAIWLLPPLLLLWVNLHGGYVIGLVMIGLTIVGEGIALALGRPVANLRTLILAAIGAGLATLLSPNGIEALRYPFTYAGTGNASQRFIAEWQSPDFHQGTFLPLAASLILGLLVGYRRDRWRPSELLWVATLALMALQSTRHAPLYAIVTLPLLGARLSEILPGWPRRLERLRPTLSAALPLFGWAFAVVGLGALLLGSGSLPLQTGREPLADGYPAEGTAYLQAHPELTGNLFNTYAWGGYLIDQLYPERRVFIDGRADVHGDALVTSARATERLAPEWRANLDRWDIRLVLVEKDSPLATALRDDPAWHEVLGGKVERLFVKSGKWEVGSGK